MKPNPRSTPLKGAERKAAGHEAGADSGVAVIGELGAASFRVRVVPRAGQTLVAGVREGALLVRLAAPPVDGAANDVLIAFLSRLLGRPTRDIRIVAGQRSRDKRVSIVGISLERLAANLSAILHA